ncbi:uncharacterized protein [Mycetomoellerius zeteki]|uniref:uncharacterized protein n=1 Tax=Mycetomoellerius zeteki TaxID=64791 RepID=UPI00084E7A5C|nr:PREDICTED: uncharacterized protein LOC108724316 [Trachymyrmex zeteki]
MCIKDTEVIENRHRSERSETIIYAPHSPQLKMMTKIFVLIGTLVAVCSARAGVIPAAIPAITAAVPAALTVGTYATSYNAHAINHAIAAPYVAAAPLAYSAYSAYPALPAAAYSAPIIAGRR